MSSRDPPRLQGTFRSDPGALTQLCEEMGVARVNVEEIHSYFGLQSLLDLEGEKIYGFAFASTRRLESNGPTLQASELGIFFPQVSDSASCPQAVLAVLLNAEGLDIGPRLANFKASAAGLDLHLFRDCEPDVHHWISYICRGQKVYELNCLKPGPVFIADVPAGASWVQKVGEEIQLQMEAQAAASEEDAGCPSFCMVAIMAKGLREARDNLTEGLQAGPMELRGLRGSVVAYRPVLEVNPCRVWKVPTPWLHVALVVKAVRVEPKVIDLQIIENSSSHEPSCWMRLLIHDDGFRKIKEARASGSEYSWTAEEARSAVLYVPPPSIARVLGDDSRFSAAEAAVQPLPPWTLLSCEPHALCTGAPLRFYEHLKVPVAGKCPWCFLCSLRRQGFEEHSVFLEHNEAPAQWPVLCCCCGFSGPDQAHASLLRGDGREQ